MPQTKPLERILRSNAVFSGLCGVLMVVFAGSLSPLFASPVPWLFPAVGVGLVGFSAQIFLAIRNGSPSKLVLWYFSASDFAWVAGSALLLLSGLVVAPLAVSLVIGAALVVLAFALLQVRHRSQARV